MQSQETDGLNNKIWNKQTVEQQHAISILEIRKTGQHHKAVFSNSTLNNISTLNSYYR